MFALSALALGQDQSQPPISDQIVAHLSTLNGNVSTERADTGDWVAGAINTPLVSGDKVAAGAGSRAEVQIDYADLLRLGDNANVNLVTLTKSNIQVQLGAGLADYVVLNGAQAKSEIDTPNIAVYPQKAGVYRILVSSNSETQVIVRRGEAEVSTPQGSTRLKQGQQITVEGVDSPQYQITDAPARDSWDQWNEARDSASEAAEADNHANRYYTGAQAMNGYGNWANVPGYGEVWVPDNEGSGWTPYSNGQWTWEPYWGWTWVSYEPWGWAPFHYGRWFVYGANWVWWPGPVTPYYQPLWAPAYVSFFGWGGGLGVGVGFGSVGWLPIGPCDPYRPWWGGRGYYGVRYSNINITNVYVTNNVYRRSVLPPLAVAGHERVAYSNLAMMRTNPRVRQAVIRVPSTQFAHGAVQGRTHITAAEVRQGTVIGGTLPVVPGRGSLSASREARPGHVPARTATHFFGQRGTVSARPDFTEERASVEHALSGAPATRTARPERPRVARAPAAASQPQHFNSAGSSRVPAEQPRVERPEQQARPGWQSFSHGSEPAHPAARGAAPQARAPRNATPQHTTPRRAAPQARAPRTAKPAGPGGGGWQSFRPNGGGTEPEARSFAPQAAPRRGFEPSASERPPLEVGHPIVNTPRYQAPSYRAPAYRAPAYRAPAYHPAPSYRAPAYHAPAYHAPSAARTSHPGGGHPHRL